MPPPSSSASFFPRQLRRLATVSRAQAAHAPPLAGLEEAVAWFTAHFPSPESVLVHGDYKIDNLVLLPGHPTPSGHPSLRVSGVLDWELVSLGHPLTDLANLAAAHWVPYAPGSGTLCGLGGVEVGWADTGIPTEGELIGLYCDAAGRDRGAVVAQWPFFKAWWLFKYAVIAQGIAARSARGVASSAAAAAAGAFAPVLMEAALAEMGVGAAGAPATSREPARL
jgi:aminoglycoside phosphotransferase (APT) family kinase protein